MTDIVDIAALFIGRAMIAGFAVIGTLMVGLWVVERIMRHLRVYRYVLAAMVQIYRERNAPRDESEPQP